ncbi:ABC transporter permease [Rhodobacteraceae bacterium DSL-40]|uniref:ABC transporter permease n=1 Tax=Amaricoccus sp. B4 TaxID=3368557 RepID=UPI000DAE5800
MLRLEPRTSASPLVEAITPVGAVIATMVAGGCLFALLGKNPFEAIHMIFVAPLLDPYSRSEMLIKATPLVLIALGLSFGFRAGVWNIGAEGQYVMGGLAGSAVALAFWNVEGAWLLPLMVLAGMAGGCLWAMIPAVLKVRFNANEILVSLMLVYVAGLFLSAMVSGPLKDPQGFNFPQSRLFHDSARLPVLLEGSRVHVGVLVALAAVVLAQVLLHRHMFGFNVRLLGQAPRAAAFSGVNANRLTVICLALSGSLAGLAGIFEVAGPIGQLQPSLPVGYGFTAIIVAFLGRLSPIGILLAGLVMALTYIGGETAQFALGIPKAAISVFQGMLLFFLLAADLLTRYRIARIRRGVV